MAPPSAILRECGGPMSFRQGGGWAVFGLRRPACMADEAPMEVPIQVDPGGGVPCCGRASAEEPRFFHVGEVNCALLLVR